MKPIETTYNGYRFRSRLEARWAVFLDAMGIRYEYEKEGYDLNGLWYLPDFWLPIPPQNSLAIPKETPHHDGIAYWLEIKPRPLVAVEEEKIKRLVRYTGHHAYAITGNVGQGEYYVSKWAINRETQEVWCVYKEEDDSLSQAMMWFQLQPTDANASIEDALNIARSARFEHGENMKVLCPPYEKWYVNSLGLSDIDGGGRHWWIESEDQPGEVIYFCGNDKHLPEASTLAEGIVEAHNLGDLNGLRYFESLVKALNNDEEGI